MSFPVVFAQFSQAQQSGWIPPLPMPMESLAVPYQNPAYQQGFYGGGNSGHKIHGMINPQRGIFLTTRFLNRGSYMGTPIPFDSNYGTNSTYSNHAYGHRTNHFRSGYSTEYGYTNIANTPTLAKTPLSPAMPDATTAGTDVGLTTEKTNVHPKKSQSGGSTLKNQSPGEPELAPPLQSTPSENQRNIQKENRQVPADVPSSMKTKPSDKPPVPTIISPKIEQDEEEIPSVNRTETEPIDSEPSSSPLTPESPQTDDSFDAGMMGSSSASPFILKSPETSLAPFVTPVIVEEEEIEEMFIPASPGPEEALSEEENATEKEQISKNDKATTMERQNHMITLPPAEENEEEDPFADTDFEVKQENSATPAPTNTPDDEENEEDEDPFAM